MDDLASILGQLATLLATQSLLAVGGMNVILPDLHRVVVTEGQWVSETDFTSLFALGQAAPGPNMLFITLLGWRIGGAVGAAVATLAFILPAALVASSAARAWTAWGTRAWFVALRRGLVPLTIGLMVASAALLGLATGETWATRAVLAASVALSLATKLPPIAILGAAAALGAAGLV